MEITDKKVKTSKHKKTNKYRDEFSYTLANAQHGGDKISEKQRPVTKGEK